jgi:integrase
MRGRVELRLSQTKAGLVQSVEIEREPVRRLLLWLVRRTPRGKTLFSVNYATFHRAFVTVTADLGLDRAFVPHSLRHGGATSLRQRGVSMETIKQRGRWRSLLSAERYVQSGRALVLHAAVPDRVARAADILAANLSLAFARALSQ